MKRFISQRHVKLAALTALLLGPVVSAHAAAPAWVADAITAANTTFTEYLGAAAPVAAAVVAVFGGFKLIMGLISRITQGRS